MVEVLALEEDGSSGPSRSVRPPLEHSPPLKHGLPPPERDVLDAAITDLRAPLDIFVDLVMVSEDLERTRLNLLKEAVNIDDNASSPRSTSTMSHMASPRLEMAQAGQDKFINEAVSWVRS
jgi:hypothetical protein